MSCLCYFERMKMRVVALVLFVAASGAWAAAPKFEADVLPYFQTHCLRCHGEKKQESDFRIDKLSRNVGKENVPQWAEVMERISSGEMPPKKVKTPPAAKESAVVVEWLAARIKEGEAARMAQRGRVSYNRLTREEYVNTVRSLIGVHFDATDPSGFPEDPEWHGFERLAPRGRRRLRARPTDCRPHHAEPRRCRPDDHRDAARQHHPRRRACHTLISLIL